MLTGRCQSGDWRPVDPTRGVGWAVTGAAAIQAWSNSSAEAIAATEPDGDFFKKHLINPAVFRLLGAVAGRRVLDAGAGTGYLSRLLAARGAVVTAVEPAGGLFSYGAAREAELGQGIEWVQADLTSWESGPVFDVVIASMVFLSIPDWTAALDCCVRALRPGGQLIFSIDHPCFEPGVGQWTDAGVIPLTEYLAEYVMHRPVAPDTHRPLSTYLNAVIAAGCELTEVVEPGLDPALVAGGPPGAAVLVHVPLFLIVAATRT